MLNTETTAEVNVKEPLVPTLENGILQVGVSTNYYPYEYMENGEFKGIEVDIIKAIAEELQVEVRFEKYESIDLLTNLTEKKVDCVIGLSETKERNELASASYTVFAEGDYKYIIYLHNAATELKAGLNETINTLRTNGTVNSIYRKHAVKTGLTRVYFDPNGGEGTRIIEFANRNTSITMKDTVLVRPGYTFRGWGKYPGGEALYKVGKYFEVGNNSEYVLYAIWQKNTNTIIFDANGGTGQMDSSQAETGNGVSLPMSTFTREGYTFLGWSENPNSKKPEYKAYEIFWVGTKSVYRLYAIWTPN